MKAQLTLKQLDELWLLNDYAAKTYIYKKGWLKKPCEYCGSQITVKSHRKSWYCSRKCEYLGNKTPVKYYKYNCIECKKPFSSKFSTNVKFCSKSCARRNHHARNVKFPKTNKCITCKTQYNQLSSKHIYCSDKCYPKKQPHKKVIKFCKTCSKKLDNSQKTYCNKDCKPKKKVYNKPVGPPRS